MICPNCQLEQGDDTAECAGCGVVFAKLRPGRPSRPPRAGPGSAAASKGVDHPWVALLFGEEGEVDPLALSGRLLLFLGVAAWSLPLIGRFGAAGRSFLHNINLPFHEAGHILFMPLGRFLMFVGGSLTQVTIPLICAGVLLVKTRDRFGSALCLWWAGENLLDLAPYVADARALQLVLIGGHTGAEVEGHDWEAILKTLGLLRYDVTLGRAFHFVGTVVMAAALLWAGGLLWRQARRWAEKPRPAG